MTITCPLQLDVSHLKQEVRRTYASVASNPHGDFHFHRGPEYAARMLGYDPAELEVLPKTATSAFAGVGNPFDMESLPVGARIVDIGSGAGMDCLLAGKRVGRNGTVVGVDMTDEMLERARQAAHEAGLEQVRFEKADIEALPFESASVDVVMSNGVFNLVPDKEALFRELYRVVTPGGRLQFADIIVGVELSEAARNDIDLWTGWIAGALQVAEMLALLEQTGFRSAVPQRLFDSFAGTSKERVARKYQVQGANFIAYK